MSERRADLHRDVLMQYQDLIKLGLSLNVYQSGVAIEAESRPQCWCLSSTGSSSNISTLTWQLGPSGHEFVVKLSQLLSGEVTGWSRSLEF